MSKISHSAWQKYLNCPKMYDLHYNHRLRPTGTSSALKFGVAIDEGLNDLLMKKDLNLAIETFRKNFQWNDLTDVVWDDRDSDPSIVNPLDVKDPLQYPWACMRVKGRMLLESYYQEIYPLIEEVYDVQKDLHNRPGVLDAVVKLRGYGRVLLDHKTSARPYQPGSPAISTQLALYAKDQGIKRVGFAVLVKQIRRNTKRICTVCDFDGSFTRHKTCPKIVNGTRCHGAWDESHSPKAEVQLLVEDMPDAVGELVEASMSEVEKAIQNKIFPRNLNACGKMYGKPCPYSDYCWKGDKSMLEYKENTNPKEKK